MRQNEDSMAHTAENVERYFSGGDFRGAIQ